MYVIRVSNGYLSLYHGTFKTRESADRVAARWNRVFKRRGQPVVATAQPLMGSGAHHRDMVVDALVEDLQWRNQHDNGPE